ncbi:MAG: hypothetical protein D6689_18245 [Deltaproteobacteria bacterium]|nr:MAG: hypothetical protein D6689_18245 [Deltaproteobacteria bacterium]
MRTFLFCLLLGCLAPIAGCGGGDSHRYDSIREAAEAMGGALCNRAVECGELSASDRRACTNEIVDYICSQTACSARPSGTNDDIDDCIDDIDSMSCSADDLPSSCNGVL